MSRQQNPNIDSGSHGFGGGGWGGHKEYMQDKTDKLGKQYHSKARAESQALAGLVIHVRVPARASPLPEPPGENGAPARRQVDGHTGQSKDDLAILVAQHSGTYSQYRGTSVTHPVSYTHLTLPTIHSV